MKRITKIALICTSLLYCISCSEELTSLNEDKKNAVTASAETFFSNAQKELSDHMFATSYTASGPGVAKLFAQLVTSVTYLEGVTYVKDFSWTTLYRDIIKDLNESSRIIAETQTSLPEEQKQLKNQQAMVEIMTVYAYAVLVESYGNIPYTEAMDFENVLPKFDDAKTVYLDLINRLNTAIANLDPSGTSFGDADLIYAGNVSKWIKFGNSLRLRMGMRIIDEDPAAGEAAVLAAIEGGVFSSNDDNALFRYLSEYPNSNPWWSFLVRQNLRYFIGTKPLVDYLNQFNDPRRSAYLIAVDGEYKGGESGLVHSYLDFSSLGDRFRDPELPNIFMDYAAVEFFLAEAEERGISTGKSAEDHYNAAIRASFDYYGVSGVEEYLAQPAVNYNTAGSNWKEVIGIQKWLALFEQGFEAWTEYRRLDYPILHAPAAAHADVVPRRFIYPITEQTLNGANYSAAAAAIGGDEYDTKLFWDIN